MSKKQTMSLFLALLVLLGAGCLARQPGEGEMPIPTIGAGETVVATAVVATPTAATVPAATETAPAATTAATATTATVAAPPAATATPVVVVGTNVQYIMGLVDLNLRDGPGLGYPVVGWMTHGQIAHVSGMSAGGDWWELDCPSNSRSICWVSAASAYTQPEPGATRVQFAPGTTSETLSGSIDGQTQVRYVLGAAAGQTMVIQASSPNNSVLFHVQGLHDGHIYKHLLDGELSWQGQLPQTQDYLLVVEGVGAVTSYSLYVSITDQPPAEPPTATATSVPIPGGPLYPVVDAQTGTLLGGTQNGVWIDAQTYATYLQDAERPYNLYTSAGYQGNVTGSRPATGGICAQPLVTLQPATNLAGAVALVATWDATPRLAEALPVDTPPYREIVAGLLQEAGLAEPQVQIDSIRRIDLEGDGIDEVVITASRFASGAGTPAVSAGDYSLVLLRKTNGEVTTTVPLALDVYPEANALAYPFHYDILGLMDLSGDGRLEILVEADRYEGRTVTAYEVTPAGMQHVLQAGCVQ